MACRELRQHQVPRLRQRLTIITGESTGRSVSSTRVRCCASCLRCAELSLLTAPTASTRLRPEELVAVGRGRNPTEVASAASPSPACEPSCRSLLLLCYVCTCLVETYVWCGPSAWQHGRAGLYERWSFPIQGASARRAVSGHTHRPVGEANGKQKSTERGAPSRARPALPDDTATPHRHFYSPRIPTSAAATPTVAPLHKGTHTEINELPHTRMHARLPQRNTSTSSFWRLPPSVRPHSPSCRPSCRPFRQRQSRRSSSASPS